MEPKVSVRSYWEDTPKTFCFMRTKHLSAERIVDMVIDEMEGKSLPSKISDVQLRFESVIGSESFNISTVEARSEGLLPIYPIEPYRNRRNEKI